jgi:small subunit ribosomal protein S7|uniref:Small ribosomal subunit protein uS7c n=2 Tax=Cyanidioschyzon merolae (strain NIES-3377 / 10D) TaxID=280699 RepID=RR7_CYAM1|nr:RecName: Full=Small ribosomal subunit protein uS7c; AltName: Full=30S ribosomal protein S7, chloroplastic [Cyanidioschyzon merolae strain 10D]BAC76257.1 30S ribosomal protein S7 [Cyanidioschyzon merolae strain 10D]
MTDQGMTDQSMKSRLVELLIVHVLRKGKKSLARRIVYEALKRIEERNQQSGVLMLEQAVSQVMPLVCVKARRVGGATYQVPQEVKPYTGINNALRWIVKYAKDRSGKSMAIKLAAEIWDAAHGTGGAIRKKEETHRMAEANKAFAHYR